jgi:hypothetical protein
MAKASRTDRSGWKLDDLPVIIGEAEPDRDAGPPKEHAMRVVVTTNDIVRLSFLRALLADAGIDVTVLDAHASAIEGSIGAIPRRLVVATEDEARARRVLVEAGEI